MFSDHDESTCTKKSSSKYSHKYTELLTELNICNKQNQNDPFLLFLEASLRQRLGDRKGSLLNVIQSLNIDPLNWECWCLAIKLSIGEDNENEDQLKKVLNQLKIPTEYSFMVTFFEVKVLLGLQSNPTACMKGIQTLMKEFPSFSYLQLLLGTLHYNLREFEVAQNIFTKLISEENEPMMLEAFDLLSNILYIQEDKEGLAALAQRAYEIDPLRAESCCVAGNFWSLRQQHSLAILQFQKALKLDPDYLSAWVLMGHEYLEERATSAAIESYRNGLKRDANDYRAWYGLGQTYELLKMNTYALYYYKKAANAKPLDSRMWSALSTVYQQLGEYEKGIEALRKGTALDPQDSSLVQRLGKLLLKSGKFDEAVSEYGKLLSIDSFVK